ncbi:Acyl-CoA-binding protein, ACBP [Dillenia turbinata]|uniref:Acyl-CoA-binding protein, ACBP n=1 Tax=Dillenia turbinata TaxID=194707 RepID=A0AAN8ZS30_9MAGN
MGSVPNNPVLLWRFFSSSIRNHLFFQKDGLAVETRHRGFRKKGRRGFSKWCRLCGWVAMTNNHVREDFEEYAEKAKSLPPTTKDADKFILYGLYKQVTIGDVGREFSAQKREQSGMLGKPLGACCLCVLVLDELLPGKTTDEAMTDYIAKVKQLPEAASA